MHSRQEEGKRVFFVGLLRSQWKDPERRCLTPCYRQSTKTSLKDVLEINAPADDIRSSAQNVVSVKGDTETCARAYKQQTQPKARRSNAFQLHFEKEKKYPGFTVLTWPSDETKS
uniref:Uncharacterized protein n=1 Tax=Steinernema glaseri TaxID=37863 RepID=A0A1I7ZNT7_9BILA